MVNNDDYLVEIPDQREGTGVVAALVLFFLAVTVIMLGWAGSYFV